MIDDLMQVFAVQSIVRFQGVRKDLGSRLDMVLNVALEQFFLRLSITVDPDLAATFRERPSPSSCPCRQSR